MIIELFTQSDVDNGLNLIIVSYFDRMYEMGDFMKAIELSSRKWTLCTDGAYCNFPDMDSSDEEEHFVGVQFAMGYPPTEEDTIVVSEAVCYQYVRLACQKYLQRHPEDIDKINELLAKMPI